MCTDMCESSYGAKMRYVKDKIESEGTISPSNGYVQFLRTKTSMKCVKAFLDAHASKIK